MKCVKNLGITSGNLNQIKFTKYHLLNPLCFILQYTTNSTLDFNMCIKALNLYYIKCVKIKCKNNLFNTYSCDE